MIFLALDILKSGVTHSMVGAVLGLLFAFLLIKAVIRLSPGNDRMRQIARAKAIYEQLHPETKQGGARQSSGHRGHLQVPSFADQAAMSTGQSARTIRRSCAQ